MDEQRAEQPAELLRLPGGLLLSARQYFALVLALGVATFTLGVLLVDYLRHCCRKTKSVYKLAAVAFFTPFMVFIGMNVLLLLGFAERMMCDSLTFFVAMGILFRLTNKPRGPNCIKIVAVEGAKCVDVWFDDMDMTVGDVRGKIAEAMGVTPASRVAIESGKGAFAEDLSKQFRDIVDEALISADFFGYVAMTCHVVVKEDERRRDEANPNGALGTAGASEKVERRGSLFNLLTKSEIRYGEHLTLQAKPAGSEGKASFIVACVDKFAAAAPGTLHIHINAPTLKLLPWSGEGSANVLDAQSDNQDSQSNSSAPHGSPLVKKSARKRLLAKSLVGAGSGGGSGGGKPAAHGDMVVLEHDGKFMSVTRGWWMSWSSIDPRRSGAFTIEILEKAPQNKLEAFKEKLLPHSHSTDDHVLRTGDVFRLRSVKFPEFELGLTSVKIRDEYCYLGLRKMMTPADTADDNWCMEMRFVFKA